MHGNADSEDSGGKVGETRLAIGMIPGHIQMKMKIAVNEQRNRKTGVKRSTEPGH